MYLLLVYHKVWRMEHGKSFDTAEGGAVSTVEDVEEVEAVCQQHWGPSMVVVVWQHEQCRWHGATNSYEGGGDEGQIQVKR